MQEALQEKNVIEKLQELGYKPSIYVYGMTQPSVSLGAAALFGVFAMAGNQPKPFILGFAETGICLLELNATCSKYTGLHAFIATETIEEISFKKGLVINTLSMRTKDSNKQVFKISKVTAGVPWQKANVEKLEGFINTYQE